MVEDVHKSRFWDFSSNERQKRGCCCSSSASCSLLSSFLLCLSFLPFIQTLFPSFPLSFPFSLSSLPLLGCLPAHTLLFPPFSLCEFGLEMCERLALGRGKVQVFSFFLVFFSFSLLLLLACPFSLDKHNVDVVSLPCCHYCCSLVIQISCASFALSLCLFFLCCFVL